MPTGSYDRNLIEASLDPLVTISSDGTITDVNVATTEVTGRLRDELIGTDFSTYFTEPGRAKAGYEAAFRAGSVRNYELEIRHRDGTITPVVYNATVYRDGAGEVAGVFAAARHRCAGGRVMALDTIPIHIDNSFCILVVTRKYQECT